jgi:hypothetical protein
VYGLKHQKEKRSINHFAGLDVSVKESSVCIVDDTGRVAADRKMIRYRSCRPPDTELRTRLRDLANQRRRFGYRRLFTCCGTKASHPASTASTGSIARRDWPCTNAEAAARQ